MSGILFDVKAERGSPFYGRLVVSNIRPNGSNPVKVKKYVYVKFQSPAHIGNSDFNVVTQPWVDVSPDISNQKIGNGYLVRAKLNFQSPYTFNGQETFTIYVNGDLDREPGQYTGTFSIATDKVIAADQA